MEEIYMHIKSELSKGTFVSQQNGEATANRMKAYNDGIMKLLAKANETMAENQGKEGKN